MRLFRSIIIASLFLLPTFAACGGDDGGDEEPFDTFQACFDDHHLEEDFGVVDSIKICCIDHPIGGAAADVVCGESAADCEGFLDTALAVDSASEAEITTACEEYIVERDQ